MDPEADTQQLHHFCLDGFPDTDASLTDCRLAACEHLLPEMPGLVYKMNTTGFALTSRQDWSGPISESSALLAEILAAGEHARCEEVVFLAAVLYTMEVDGEPIPWDLDSARAALGLARWHDQSCPGAKARFAEVLHFVPGDILERVQREEAAAE